MTKQLKILFISLVVVIGLLSFLTTYFFQKSRKISDVSDLRVSPSSTLSNPSSPSPQKSNQNNQATSSSDKPSKPTDTYTIAKGDSLLSIAQKNGLTANELSGANGLEDANKIQAGQVLIIPKGGVVNFTLDTNRAGQLQAAINNGKYAFRADPVETARVDAPSVYGISVNDDFQLKSKDNGRASVSVKNTNGIYLITLSQPLDKGDKGLWVIETISQEK